jgi:hypothetical protein
MVWLRTAGIEKFKCIGYPEIEILVCQCDSFAEYQTVPAFCVIPFRLGFPQDSLI